MNELVPVEYAESVRRAALGVELRDVLRGTPPLTRVDVAVEPPGGGLPARPPDKRSFERHGLVYRGRLHTPVQLRFDDRGRRFVPRRLRFAVPAQPPPDGQPWMRLRLVGLYPGAAYPFSRGATGLRGRVKRGGVDVKWTRVEARINGEVVGRAHGDDRGEFLLLLGPPAAGPGDLELRFPAEVTISLPPPPAAVPAPAPPGPRRREQDRLQDLAVEDVPDGIPGLGVAIGAALPNGYQPAPPVNVTFDLGAVTSREFNV